MSEPFIGEIRMVGFHFAPYGWANCDGQIISIAQNTALFALLGTTYGGDGESSFGLPDLRSRVPMHTGQGLGLSSRPMGQRSGSETNTLSTTHLANHSHTGTLNASTDEGDRTDPAGAFPARPEEPVQPYAGSSGATMAAGAVQIGNTGNGSPVNNMPPYLVIRFVIAMTGVWPSQN